MRRFGRRLEALLEARRPGPVSSACDAFGLNYTQVLDVIKGRKSPTVLTLGKMLGAIGASYAELFLLDVQD